MVADSPRLHRLILHAYAWRQRCRDAVHYSTSACGFRWWLDKLPLEPRFRPARWRARCNLEDNFSGTGARVKAVHCICSR